MTNPAPSERRIVTHECPKCGGGSYGPGECRGHLAAGFHTPYAVVLITPKSHHWKPGTGCVEEHDEPRPATTMLHEEDDPKVWVPVCDECAEHAV